MEEKRKRKRKKDKYEVSIEPIQHNNLLSRKKIHYTLTKNISLIGTKILTDTPPPINNLMRITLRLPKTPRVVIVTGKIKWVKSLQGNEWHETGLEFIDTPQESIMVLMEHIYGELSVS